VKRETASMEAGREVRPFKGWSGRLWPMLLLAVQTTAVCAHSASDAYLTLTVDTRASTGTVVRGQWDIALRDLDFVLKLDDNGDGRLTWGEVRRHQGAIERYAYRFLRLDGDGGASCRIRPARQMIDEHADGAYAVLFFDLVCARAPKKLTLDYAMFFAVDPSHRGIFVMNDGANAATAVLSPQNAEIDLAL
jgi:hypothetical protein